AQRKAEEPKTEKPRENPAPRRSIPAGGKGGTGQPVDLRKIREIGKNPDKRRQAEQAQRKAEEPKTEK
ncbi:hypothetical protein, partial [Amycolatopsis sp. WAC 01416]|uniref:hypothetical protein n=1 Tax=Amycolatopsis sp. WAC 01416 TaxID=2203196 RepID=UPI001F19CB4C